MSEGKNLIKSMDRVVNRATQRNDSLEGRRWGVRERGSCTIAMNWCKGDAEGYKLGTPITQIFELRYSCYTILYIIYIIYR